MRLAVDARPLLPEPTGVGRTLAGLFEAWLRLFPADRIILLSPREIHVPDALVGRVCVGPRRPFRLPGTLWLQTQAPVEARLAGADLFFGPLGILPLASSLPGVAVVHDLTPLLFPAWHSLKNRLGFNPFIGATVRVARGLATVSESTRRDLVDAFPDAEGRAVVVLNGLSPLPEAAEAPPPNDGRPYVLYLGTLEPRKNLERLLVAMETIWDRRPDFPRLLLAGGAGWGLPALDERLRSSRHAARLRPVGYVSPAETGRLLRGARLLAYPSLYEGFGLPPLEAMSVGTPVVGSSSSSLPEVLDDAGLLPDPLSVSQIAAAIERAQDDEVWRSQARRRGLERARLFTWDRAARQMRALCEQALG